MTDIQRTKASLFVTCIIDQMYPQVGASVVRVLRKSGVEVDFPLDQTCCGQPLYNSGFTEHARKLARRVIHSFKDSQYIIVPSGSCAAMIKVFYLDLLADDPELLPQAQELAAKTYEFSAFLVNIMGAANVDATYSGKTAYHPSCHLLRELGISREPITLLENVSSLQLNQLPQAENCCGFGGTFAVKFPHISESMMFEKARNVVSSGADTLVSCDMGCLMNIGGGLSRQGSDIQVKHLAQVLDQEAE